ncbi:MAG: hypothetical protein C0505_16715 [Leptothrix sp. (in: Bacteria)]|nr:hypothetical protein [Leptothrix sp. (in: b-proteobacteria)]
MPAVGLQGCATPAPAWPAGNDWFVFLESGRKTPDDRAAVAAMQKGHIDNFKRLFADGRLFAAGPMRDPAGSKRGMVTVKAGSLAELRTYFEPDAYVREGYMTLNAVPATPRKALNTEGIDATRIEEVRIVQLTHRANDDAAAARQAFLRGLRERGAVGAWYTLHEGPVAEVLFVRSTDNAALQAAFSGLPGGGDVLVWGQWLSPGVVR